MQIRAGATATEPAYADLAGRLQRIVGGNVTAPPGLIEDACQVAWGRWLVRRDEVLPASLLGWLVTTATREAIRMLRTRGREVPLSAIPSTEAEVIELPARSPAPADLAEFRERLAEVRRLPLRQQRMVWMHGLGFDYAEIADRTGDSRRTVERQLLRAKTKLRQVT